MEEVFKVTNYKITDYDQEESYNYLPPNKIRLKYYTDDDTHFINPRDVKWQFRYLGRKITINFNKCSDLPLFLQNLVKNFLVDRTSNHAPSTVNKYFDFFSSTYFLTLTDLKLPSILTLYYNLFKLDSINVKSSFSSALIEFYRWGLNKKIVYFKQGILFIIEDLPIERRNSYDSIYLNQNYISPSDEAIIVQSLKENVAKCTPLLSNISLKDTEYSFLKDTIILLISYELAPRAAQIHLMNIDDFEVINAKDKSFYQVRIPIIKQGYNKVVYTDFRPVSERLGILIESYIKYTHLFKTMSSESEPLFYDDSLNNRINDHSLSSIFLRHHIPYSFTDMRHHLAQSLADQGAPAEVISERMGHVTLTAAKAYIAATPKIAEIKNKALGSNNTYQSIMHTLMTGEIISKKDNPSPDKVVQGSVGGAGNMKYMAGIGACNYSGFCPKNPMYSCYTCKKFNPFTEGPHKELLYVLRNEALTFINNTLDIAHSRPITQLEETIEAVQDVINRIEGM